ncbi:GNAT family N-acetyltransferase [Allokutzneria sp. A3M-2-11 16]|uniref:GNAT family N-acetyltransferase n=1 Tax=Allokutzneria sp. A3M-2-11 16 TaxID=2962043 RepID=UPI0020B6B906|nr:GNAT family N-acetyltransferase [Allokutzneria sp. A3M-2-11 16]MCP3800635.1 GNAT family N-acetyltransferase [Allokutzneria sp. A3M-2-11 16]
MMEIAPLVPADRERWEVLARRYKDFYKTVESDEGYDRTWQRLLDGRDVHGIAAHVDGRLVGIAHFLFHSTVWMDDSCYLQDLFVDEAARGHGVARALIERVEEAARDRECPRLYWQTHQDNATARALYDKVATFGGMIVYVRRLG